MPYPSVGMGDVVVELFDGPGSGRADLDLTKLLMAFVGWTQGHVSEHVHIAVTLTDRQTHTHTHTHIQW